MTSPEPTDMIEWAFQRVREKSPNPPKLPQRAAHAKKIRPQRSAHVPASSTPSPTEPREPRESHEWQEKGPDTLQPRGDGLDILRQFMRENTVERGERGVPSGLDGRFPRRKLGLPSAGQLLRREIHQRGWEAELAEGWVLGHWEEVVGKLNAEHTRPTAIKDGIVYVSCDTSNWATQMRYMQRQILQKIAETIGPDIVVKLQIQGPKQHRNYEGRQWVKPQGSQDTYG